MHYEVELLVRITRNGKSIASEFAHRYYDDISLGIDFTARDIQAAAKAQGHPWEKAKAFDGSAVVSREWMPKNKWAEGWEQVPFELKKNGRTVQSTTAESMLFHVDELIAHVSKFMTLKMGDIFFTGTPSGVGPVEDGDVLEGTLDGAQMFRVQVHG